jgi:Ca2+-binding RTX toxin-like protein
MSQLGTDASEVINATQNVVYALDGSDRVFSTQSSPDLYGGEGSDFIANSGTGDTEVYGGQGSDAIHGGTVDDELYGEDGNDLIVGGEFNWNTANTTGAIIPFLGELSGNDRLYGGSGIDALYGFEGNDFLYGDDGNDFNTNIIVPGNILGDDFAPVTAGLYGGAGNDYLNGGQGNDFLDGGTDNDRLYGDDGNDSLLGSAGLDSLNGGQGNDLLDGGTEDDRLDGDEGNDSLIGAAGTDLLIGGGDNDSLDGGTGADQMLGGLGDDTFLVDDALDTVIEAVGGGIDTVRTTISYALAAGTHVDVLRTNDDAGTLSINLTSNAFSHTLIGNAGVNVLSGLDGNDSLSGLGGNDQLLGGLGNDVMDGGTGRDLLIGGRGLDRIHTGGADGIRDTVRFTSLLDSGVSSSTRDQVRGFVRGQDKIDLSLIDANPTATGNQVFKIVKAFTSAPGEVRLVYSGSNTVIQIDGDRDTAVDAIISVIGTRITAGDLIL